MKLDSALGRIFHFKLISDPQKDTNTFLEEYFLKFKNT